MHNGIVNPSIFPSLRTGSIISARTPKFHSKDRAGNTYRSNLVLGIEIDPETHSPEGLWLCRLSSRTHLVRDWDHIITPADVIVQPGSYFNKDYVIRTPRIDLCPVNAEYLGERVKIYAQVKASFWEGFLPKLDEGQSSRFWENSFGPRDKLPHTLVGASLNSLKLSDEFNYANLIREASLEADAAAPPSNPWDDYDRAKAQAAEQKRAACGVKIPPP